MSALVRKPLKYWLAQGWSKVTDSYISSNIQLTNLIVLVRKEWSLLMFPLLFSHIETPLHRLKSKRERNTTTEAWEYKVNLESHLVQFRGSWIYFSFDCLPSILSCWKIIIIFLSSIWVTPRFLRMESCIIQYAESWFWALLTGYSKINLTFNFF